MQRLPFAEQVQAKPKARRASAVLHSLGTEGLPWCEARLDRTKHNGAEEAKQCNRVKICEAATGREVLGIQLRRV